MTPPRTGRPLSNDPRVEVFSVRLTRDEATLLRFAAGRAGLPIGVYVRERALAAAKRVK